MSEIKPITFYNHARGPNPKKIAIVFEELNIPHETIVIDDPKEESFTKINPNGRLPAIKDPNTGITLWESGAILEYLEETYDKECKLTFSSFPEKWYLKQYLHFQMSGQGPYFGQCAWFHMFHPEDIPSAKERYIEQSLRVFGVLNTILDGQTYLVGEKCTYVDLAFFPWDDLITLVIKDLWAKYEVEEKYPNFAAWHKRIRERSSVKKIYGLE
ncbi:hypothetical protein FDECE_5851 [Fusarium decemcellulare]|nr:hypothetical protein FDECE_5851 [Fusarium decemcellulare]